MKRISIIVIAVLLFAVATAHGASGEVSATAAPGLIGYEKRPVLPPIQPGSLKLTPGEIDALVLPRSRAVLNIPSIDRFIDNEDAPLQFRPISLFAEGGRIRVLANGSASEQKPARRQYYLASNTTTSIGLAVDAEFGQVTGFALRGASRMQLGGNLLSSLEFSPVEDLPEGVNSCGTDGFDLSVGTPSIPSGLSAPSMSAALAGEAISYQAVVAVDTDSEWLAGFGDDPVAAMDWITDLFLAMNVFYERDVETHLLIGDVILRIGSDPYSVASDRFGQLNEFGKYWKDNMGHIERQFAAMLSGRAISSGYFSGIAWLDQYCAKGRSWGSSTVGSFSFNAIGSSRSPGNTALYVGHEIGHNMGSPHTHCYDPPVDSCYNGDAGDGCFSGPPMCPIGGNRRGTIMSYCHVGGPSGAGCGTSNEEFHPVVQALLEDRLASEAARGCIVPYEEYVPAPEFASTPPPGATLDFGDRLVGTAGAALVVQVQNTGEADLTLTCSLAGSGNAAFTINACPAVVSPASTAEIAVSCAAGGSGTFSAELAVANNDTSQTTPVYPLLCRASEPFDESDLIFRADFED